MIDTVFSTTITDCLTPYLNQKITPLPDDGIWIVPCNASEILDTESSTAGKLTMSLVNIEEERTLNNNLNYEVQKKSYNYSYKNPPVYLNLYVLFASNSANGNNDTGDNYYIGLNKISYVIKFFQYRNVFTQQSTPGLAGTGIEELIFELRTLSFQDLNNMWGVLGSKYLPSVVYKVRMLCINEDFSEGDIVPITRITVKDTTIQQS